MSQILNKVRDLDPHDFDAAKEALSTFFPNLAKHKDGDCVRWLRTLENVINRFPKLCGSHRVTIEKYITYFLDTSSYNTAVEAAKCAHVLQQVRPGQEKAATPKVCWRDLMGALCNAVHSLVSEICPNAPNIYKINGEQENQSPDSVLHSALNDIAVVSGQNRILNRENILCTRLRNVFVFIQAMLVEVYPVAKPVRPQLILDAVIRAAPGPSLPAAVRQQALRTLDALVACEVYPVSKPVRPQLILDAVIRAAPGPSLPAAVRQQALRTLDALVACLGPNLLPFSPVVFGCALQTLRWSSEHPCEGSSDVRIAAYNSLGLWLSSLRTHRVYARGWHDELVTHITSDVTPRTHTVQLTMNNPARNLSKKQKKKQARMMLQQSSIAVYAPGEANKVTTSAEPNEQTAIAALECTEIFLNVCGMSLKPATHKVFHELLVRECFHLEDYSSDRGLALLRALEASRRSAPPGVPPPTQYCLQIYSARINSQRREISKFCSEALLDIRLHLHCSPPSLNFAAEAQTEQKKDAEDNRRLSRRNREALESLLGADKLPPETDVTAEPEEPEEPDKKKARIEPDQISLSSEDSVEICETDSEVEEVPVQDNSLQVQAEIHGNDVDAIENNTRDSNDYSHQEIQDESAAEPKSNIHEATTQVYDTVDGTESLSGSMEVGYGYPTTLSVPVLENLEGENLPNTDETDDVHITCGQVAATPDEVKDSGEVKNDFDEVKNSGEVRNLSGEVTKDLGEVENDAEVKEIKVNGIKTTEEESVVEGSVTVKMVANGVSVEDMLADFVDEVNDDNITQV